MSARAATPELIAAGELEQAPAASRSPARMALQRLSRSRLAMVGLAVIGAMVVLALLAPWIAPYDPEH